MSASKPVTLTLDLRDDKSQDGAGGIANAIGAELLGTHAAARVVLLRLLMGEQGEARGFARGRASKPDRELVSHAISAAGAAHPALGAALQGFLKRCSDLTTRSSARGHKECNNVCS